MQRLSRDDFFGHEKVVKLAKQIAKRTRMGHSYLNIKDDELINLLISNKDWLDYIGIYIRDKGEKIMLRWEII